MVTLGRKRLRDTRVHIVHILQVIVGVVDLVQFVHIAVHIAMVRQHIIHQEQLNTITRKPVQLVSMFTLVRIRAVHSLEQITILVKVQRNTGIFGIVLHVQTKALTVEEVTLGHLVVVRPVDILVDIAQRRLVILRNLQPTLKREHVMHVQLLLILDLLRVMFIRQVLVEKRLVWTVAMST